MSQFKEPFSSQQYSTSKIKEQLAAEIQFGT
jgi:hypothetical protein